MKKLVSAAAGAALALSLTACGTVIHGTNQKETFVSQPSAAHIKVDGVSYGKTPRMIKLTRSDQHVITISLPGYKPAHFKLTKKVSGWFFGNLLLGGVGFIVDAVDGAIYTLKPGTSPHGKVVEGKSNTLTIVLEKKGSTARMGRKIGQLKAAQ
jgi:hypothetical protein